jgi:hypothetical protein
VAAIVSGVRRLRGKPEAPRPAGRDVSRLAAGSPDMHRDIMLTNRDGELLQATSSELFPEGLGDQMGRMLLSGFASSRFGGRPSPNQRDQREERGRPGRPERPR